jgi:S-adenosylmethionine:tRNA ribosyltransferase-isomerase
MSLQTLRTLLFVPGDRPERFDKALQSGADAIALDLEDAVLPEAKAQARLAIAGWTGTRSPQVIVRINSEDTPWFEDDLEMVRASGYSEIMLPKASDPEVVRRIAKHLGPSAGIYPIIETVQGAVRMREVAAVKGVRRLLFGTVDFSRDSGIQHEDGWLPIRVEMVLASRLAGLASPIDGTLLGWNDPQALRAQAVRSRSLGFGGRLCIHPAQVAPIREGMGATCHRCGRSGDPRGDRGRWQTRRQAGRRPGARLDCTERRLRSLPPIRHLRMESPAMRLSDFDFELPDELIAREPAAVRSASRLMVPEGPAPGAFLFADLPSLLNPGDLLIMNDSRVIKARLKGRKASGGAVEALVERVTSRDEALAMLRVSKPPQIGSRLLWAEGGATVLGRQGEFWRLRFDEPVLDVLERQGELPLPPYMGRAPQPGDDARYQTTYAREPGSVAAPTAGLHFDEALLERLAERGVERAFVTLHVGAGTFQPVRSDDISQHRMHSERYRIDQSTVDAIRAARARGARIIAVGTTSLRTLEAVAARPGGLDACEDETALFITPGYRFRLVDRLITNFHLPRSTLLMLVSAFAGVDTIRAAYARAIAERWRFFSYGDAMLLDRRTDEAIGKTAGSTAAAGLPG